MIHASATMVKMQVEKMLKIRVYKIGNMNDKLNKLLTKEKTKIRKMEQVKRKLGARD
jgi:hypothetical protein